MFTSAQDLKIEGVLPEFEEFWRGQVARDDTAGVENGARNLGSTKKDLRDDSDDV